MSFPKFFPAVFILAVCLCFAAGCAGQNGPKPEFVLHGEVSPEWFEQMAELEKTENWKELKDLAAFVLAHDKLSDKERAWAMYYAGRVYLEEEKGSLCLSYAREAALGLPRELRPQLLLALAEYGFGNSMRGEHIFVSLLKENPESLDLLLTLARANERNSHWSEARSWYEKALQASPEDQRIRSKLALMFWMEGNAGSALAELDKVLEKKPDDAEALNDQGLINIALGRFKEARASFDRAISANPAYADARLNRANLYAVQGKPGKALDDLEAGLSSAPSNVKLLIARGQVLRSQGKYFEAYSSFETAHVLERRNPYVLNELAWFLATCGEPALRNGERAVTLAEQSVLYSKVPEPGAYDTLAAAYAANGRYDDAVLAENSAIYMAEKAGIGNEILKEWRDRKSIYERKESYSER